MTTPPTAFTFGNVRLIDPSTGRDEVGDFSVERGCAVSRLGTVNGHRVLDCTGLALLPGLIDVHVHFRDPGMTAAENLQSGARAAARGGFTHVVTMPNTVPPCDNPAAVRRQAGAATDVRILPSACITKGRVGRVPSNLAALAKAGAVAFTDDGSMVGDDGVMLAAMRLARALDIPVMDHAMDAGLMGPGVIRDSPLAARLGLPVIAPETEVAAVQRDIRLARDTGCTLHLQHLSCSGSVAALREALREGLRVSGEATPHHLLLTSDMITEDDGNWRMNPPLGDRSDRDALRRAVVDGTIAILATDHAPHTPATKGLGFAKAPFGVIGLETAVGASWQALGLESDMPLLDFAARWTTGPARLIGLPPPALAADGRPASFTLIDFGNGRRVEPDRFASRSRNCPFAGCMLPARVLMTMCEGRLTWLDPEWKVK